MLNQHLGVWGECWRAGAAITGQTPISHDRDSCERLVRGIQRITALKWGNYQPKYSLLFTLHLGGDNASASVELLPVLPPTVKNDVTFTLNSFSHHIYHENHVDVSCHESGRVTRPSSHSAPGWKSWKIEVLLSVTFALWLGSCYKSQRKSV